MKKGPRPDFVDSFFEFTSSITSPPLFRKWAAIAAIAGALERKVWVVTQGSPVYPNMYIVLVAPPGVGKSEVTWRVRDMWSNLEDHKVASSSVTKASMMDELAAASRRWVTHNPENPVESFNSLLICTNELGVLLPAYENDFMNVLTDLWDCKDYSESRRSSKKEPINLKKVQLNLFAACTPSYLVHLLPEGAWDQGFISRTMLIFSAERQIRSLFDDFSTDQGEQKIIQENIERIASIYGKMSFSEDAAQLINDWHMRGGEPKPDHPKLVSYTVRRTVHALKLAMISSVSESDDLIIEKRHVQRAFDWMVEAENHMPDIFKSMANVGTGKIMEEAWYYIYQTHAKEQKPVMSHRLIQYLQEKVPVHNIQNTIDMMEKGKMIEKRLVAGGAAYIPLGRRAE